MIPGIVTIPGTDMTATFFIITGPCSGASTTTAGSADRIGMITAIKGTAGIPGTVIIGRTRIIAMAGIAPGMNRASDSILTGDEPIPTEEKKTEYGMNSWTVRAADPTPTLRACATSGECSIMIVTDLQTAPKRGSGDNLSEAMYPAEKYGHRLHLENHAPQTLTSADPSPERRIGKI